MSPVAPRRGPRVVGPASAAWGLALAAVVASTAHADGGLPPPSRRTVVAGPGGPAATSNQPASPVVPAPPPPDVSPPFAPPPFAPPPLPPPSPRATLVPPPSFAPPPAIRPLAVPAPPPMPTAGRAPAAPASVWHVRAGGGATFGVLGMDPPDPGPTAGADVGVTFARGVGVDAFYRADVVRFRLADDPDLTKDGGTLHHVGVKLTYETPRTPGRPLGMYAGAGPTWTFTDGFAATSSGLGVHGEAGLSLDLGARWRVRVGAELRAFASDVGRNVAADAGRDRWVYTVSPVVFLQFDL